MEQAPSHRHRQFALQNLNYAIILYTLKQVSLWGCCQNGKSILSHKFLLLILKKKRVTNSLQWFSNANSCLFGNVKHFLKFSQTRVCQNEDIFKSRDIFLWLLAKFLNILYFISWIDILICVLKAASLYGNINNEFILANKHASLSLCCLCPSVGNCQFLFVTPLY